MKSRHYSDWLGFIFFVSLATYVASHSWRIGVLLLPTILHELSCGVTFLTRRPPKASLSGLAPKVFAYACTLLPLISIALGRRMHPEWFAINTNRTVLSIAGFVWLISAVLAVWNVWNLRDSFSIEPQARRLVTDGPYAFARHPIYASYVLQYLSFVVAVPHLPVLIGYVIWIAIMLVRVRYEEKVLGKAFPEYSTYRERVGAFGPKLVRSRPDSVVPSVQ